MRYFKVFIVLGAFIVWAAVILQFLLLMTNAVGPVWEIILQYFSYFTILTNLLVALDFTVLAVRPRHRLANASASTAIAVYILVVGAVYNIILRSLWAPQGLQKIVDELLHTVNPLYFLAYWIIFVPKHTLQWTNIFPWLIYPFIYCVYTLVKGLLMNFYPYPFINVQALGMEKVVLNCVILCGVFLLLSLLFVALAKIITARRLKQQRAASG